MSAVEQFTQFGSDHLPDAEVLMAATTGGNKIAGGDSNRAVQPHFMLVPSLACPASCSYCFGPHRGRIMSLETVDAAVAFIVRTVKETDQRRVKVTLHGGEPLTAGHAVVRRALNGLSEQCGPAALAAGIQSNLWFLDDEFCALFRQHRVEIGTSLDGPEDITDNQRGKGYFARTMAGIRKAQAHGLQVGCIATFTPQSLPRWRETFDFFIQERMNFSIHAAVPPLNDRGAAFALSPDQYASLLRQLLDYYIDHRRELSVSSIDQMAKGIVAGEGKVCTFRDCLGMFIAIDPSGNLYPCQRFSGKLEYRFGALAESPSLGQLLSSPVAWLFRSRQELVRKSCDGCAHLGYCRGGCPYNAWAGGNGDRSKDPYCEAYRDVFDHIWRRLATEVATAENINAVAARPYDGKGHPLLRKGSLIEIIREGPHPSQIARSAKRIVAAVELAKGPDIPTAAARLVERGVCRHQESAERSLHNLWRQLHPERVPLKNVYVHVTFNCQLRCTHCYASAQRKRYSDLDGAEAATGFTSDCLVSPVGPSQSALEYSVPALKKLICEAKDVGFRQVVITGGEPLFHSQRHALLAMLAETRHGTAPMNLVLLTNFALPFTDDDLRLIAMAYDQVVVSVDGDEISHDTRRGAGAYAATVRNLERYASVTSDLPRGTQRAEPNHSIRGRLRSPAFPIFPAELSIACVMSAADVQGDCGASVSCLAKKLRVRRVRFRPLLPLGRAAAWEEPPASEALGSHAEPIELIERGLHPVASCGFGQNLYVEPSGESFPCYSCHQSRWFLGNVIHSGLLATIQRSRFRDLARHNVDTNLKCRLCDVRYLCGGACRAWGGVTCQHDLDAPPPECTGLRKSALALHTAASAFLQKTNCGDCASRTSVEDLQPTVREGVPHAGEDWFA